MSCVTSVIAGTTMAMGADSAASGDGDGIFRIPEPKVFVRDAYLFGVTGSYRVAQVLRFKAQLPPPPQKSPEMRSFLVCSLMPTIAAALRADGVAHEGRNILGPRTSLLLGCCGQLWHIGPDLTVLPEGNYAAIGSGYMRAYSALYALEQVGGSESPERCVEIALQAAAEFTSTVRPPWQIVSIKLEDGKQHRSASS